MISGLDRTVIDLIESHPSIIIGTCDRALVPCMSRGFGARVIDGGAAIEVLVSRWPGPRTEANLAETGRVAVTFTAPETFASYQIKGQVSGLGAPTAEDDALADVCSATIHARIVALGEPPELSRTMFTPRGLFRMRFAPEVVFLQTPGSGAGQRL